VDSRLCLANRMLLGGKDEQGLRPDVEGMLTSMAKSEKVNGALTRPLTPTCAEEPRQYYLKHESAYHKLLFDSYTNLFGPPLLAAPSASKD
jgi:hypothetical protein